MKVALVPITGIYVLYFHCEVL